MPTPDPIQTIATNAVETARKEIPESMLFRISIADQVQRQVDLANQIQKQLASAVRIQSHFIIADATHEISQRLLSVTIAAGQMVRPFQATTQRVIESLVENLRNANAIATAFAEMLPVWQEHIRSIIEQTSDDLFEDVELHLINEGWYVSHEVPAGLMLKLADLYDAGDLTAIENLLKQFYSESVDEIEKILKSNFPNRRRILTAAFAAHKSEAFAVSIPTFFAQADGISQEIWEENFFRTAKSNRRLFGRSKSQLGSMSPTVRRHLKEKGALRADFKSDEPVARLNRHAVLHGTSVDYDTEANSLRCIALLHFLTWLKELFITADSCVSLGAPSDRRS
ncbi:MAG TPA: hypothetical protein VEX43_13140 [Chthoniobacterales bacterium]|nr:hypothetical protein [Chthoniobacterales bacterium]